MKRRTIRYKILVKTLRGIKEMRYKSKVKLETGEDIMFFYDGVAHIVKIIQMKKGLWPIAVAEEI